MYIANAVEHTNTYGHWGRVLSTFYGLPYNFCMLEKKHGQPFTLLLLCSMSITFIP
jgi:hypothetical protein